VERLNASANHGNDGVVCLDPREEKLEHAGIEKWEIAAHAHDITMSHHWEAGAESAQRAQIPHSVWNGRGRQPCIGWPADDQDVVRELSKRLNSAPNNRGSADLEKCLVATHAGAAAASKDDG
jgi:hypothetical protein